MAGYRRRYTVPRRLCRAVGQGRHPPARRPQKHQHPTPAPLHLIQVDAATPRAEPTADTVSCDRYGAPAPLPVGGSPNPTVFEQVSHWAYRSPRGERPICLGRFGPGKNSRHKRQPHQPTLTSRGSIRRQVHRQMGVGTFRSRSFAGTPWEQAAWAPRWPCQWRSAATRHSPGGRPQTVGRAGHLPGYLVPAL